MKLSFYQANDGDCLRLEGRDGRNILIDGGRKGTFEANTIPDLDRVRRAEGELDVVYVSHIDNDHISGILALVDLEVEWRAHDFRRAQGDDPREPDDHRPPPMRRLWHNSFRDMMGENEGAIAEQLAFNMKVLGVDPRLAEQTARVENLVTGVREGLRLAQRASPDVLGIPQNPEFDGKLMIRRPGAPPIGVGGMAVSILGPTETDLEELREEWNEWLADNVDEVEALREETVRTRRLLGLDEGTALRSAMLQLSGRLADLGIREDVTTPNLASLMLLVEEGQRPDAPSVILTGDGHTDDVLDGLEAAGRLDANGRAKVDVLKIPHHGAEANFRADFAKRVLADHYVFCGNGSHHNPELRVLEAVIDSRVGAPEHRHPDDDGERDFTLWFSSSEAQANTDARRRHMSAVETYVLETRAGTEVTERLNSRHNQRASSDAREAIGRRLQAFFLRDEERVELPEL